jgi:DNA-binding NarL/FixJ family response regulator
MLNVFVLDEHTGFRQELAACLRGREVRVVAPLRRVEAADAVTRERFDLIVCAERACGMDGLSFFHAVKYRQQTGIKVLLTDGPGRPPTAELRQAGVDYVFAKAVAARSIEALIAALIEAYRVGSAQSAR